MLHLIARLPLGLFHACGVLLGWFVWLASPRYRRMVTGNLATAGFSDPAVRTAAISHAGRGLLELLPVWFRDPAQAEALRAAHKTSASTGGSSTNDAKVETATAPATSSGAALNLSANR